MSLSAENLDIKNTYQEQLAPQRLRAAKYDSFFRGKQYTRKEKRLLRDYGLIPLAVNIVRPLLLQKRAIITSSKPTWKVVPLQGASKLVAMAGQQLLVAKWNNDYVDIEHNLAVKDCLITGTGFLFVDLASYLDNSTFDINIQHVSWRYVLPDPNARRFDLSDAENIIINKTISVSRAQALYNLTEEQARAALAETFNRSQDYMLQQVEVIDRFSKYPLTKCITKMNEGVHLRNVPQVFYTGHVEKKMRDEREALYKDMKALEEDGKIQIKEQKTLAIRRGISVGQLDVHMGLMNIQDYPIIAYIDEQGDTYADAQGETEFIEGIQRATNKFYSLVMHNAMLTGNFRVLAAEKQIKNKTQFQKTASLPGAVLEYTPDPSLRDGGVPTLIQPGALSNAFFTLQADLIEKGKFELGVYGPMLGDPQKSPETFSTTATLQDFGTQPIRELARRIDIQIAKAGEVVIQYLQNYTDKNEMLQIIDVKGDVVPPKDEQTGQPIVLNEIEIKNAIVGEIKNNTQLGKFAVKVLTQPNLGTDRMIKAAFMRDMIMNKAVPATPAVLKRLLDMMEFPGGDAIVQELLDEQSAQGKLQQAEGQLKKASQAIDQLQKENMKLRKNEEMMDLRVRFESFFNKAKLSAKDAEMARELKSKVDSMSGSTEATNG